MIKAKWRLLDDSAEREELVYELDLLIGTAIQEIPGLEKIRWSI